MSRARSRIPKMIKRFEDAVRVHEMRGALPPQDHFEIEAEYKESKKRLQNYIFMLMDNCSPTYLVNVNRESKNHE